MVDYFLATNTVLETFHFIRAPVLKTLVSLLVHLPLDGIDKIIDEQAYCEGADAKCIRVRNEYSNDGLAPNLNNINLVAEFGKV